jgi:hypothetical protein
MKILSCAAALPRSLQRYARKVAVAADAVYELFGEAIEPILRGNTKLGSPRDRV